MECALLIATEALIIAHFPGGCRLRVSRCRPTQSFLPDCVKNIARHAQSFEVMCGVAVLRRGAARAGYIDQGDVENV